MNLYDSEKTGKKKAIFVVVRGVKIRYEHEIKLQAIRVNNFNLNAKLAFL